MTSDRCVKLPEADIKSFSEEQKNVKTKKKSLYDLKLFNKFLTNKDRTSRNSCRQTTAVHDKVCAGSEKEKWETLLYT